MSDKITVVISVDDLEDEQSQVLLHNLLQWLYFAERLAKVGDNTLDVDVYETKDSKRTPVQKHGAL
jgi:hypothetical protein